MVGDWRIRGLPRCTHHVFLSHCAEDRAQLVQPIYEALENRKYLPWLDRHDYPRGRDPFAALRDGILSCRHVVPIITANSLTQGRGWTSVEIAYSELLQANLRFLSIELCAIQFPLLFLPRDDEMLRRSAWAPLIDRGRFYGPGRIDRGAIDWAIDEVVEFVKQEEIRGVEVAEQVERDPAFSAIFGTEPNLLGRIMCLDPPSTTD